MNLFQYNRKNISINYKGNRLDSLLELKYIISVEDSHLWLRSGLTIHFQVYNEQGDSFWKQYTPDFLVRNIKTNKAMLVETKPDRFDDFWKLAHCKNICVEHAGYFAYDWNYEVIYESNIRLSAERQTRFNQAISENDQTSHWYGHLLQNKICASDDDYRSMVINGVNPASTSPIGHSLRRSV